MTHQLREWQRGLASALALQPDGKIVVAGCSNASGSSDFALARYLPNGTLDTSFSGDGRCSPASGVAAMTGPTPWPFSLTARSWWPDCSNASGRDDFALARYLPNGTLDTTFSGDGKVLTDFGSGS